MDAVQSSRFITDKKSAQLIGKLESLVSRYDASRLHRQVLIAGRIKNMNESIYYNVDDIHEAISADKIFVMDKGKLAMQGTPKEIFSQVEKMKELNLDVPEVTLLAHELRKGGLDIPADILTKEELADALLGKAQSDPAGGSNGDQS